jgi:copper(I)-binding protein
MKKISLFFVLVISACWVMPTMAGHHEKGNINIDMPYVRAPVPGQNMTAAFLMISNSGEQNCKLIAANSSYAKKIEFHTHKHVDGMMQMRPVKDVDVPAGSTIAFKPGGLHLMLFEVSSSDASSAEITLSTDKCGEIQFLAPIKSLKSQPAKAMHH